MFEESDEKREFLRVDYEKPVNYKIMKGDKLAAKSDVYTKNISASGLLFRTASEAAIPALSSIIWISLDPKMMNVCSEIEENLVLHDEGVFARVVRIAEGEPGKSYDIGVCFLKKGDLTEDDLEALTSGH